MQLYLLDGAYDLLSPRQKNRCVDDEMEMNFTGEGRKGFNKSGMYSK